MTAAIERSLGRIEGKLEGIDNVLTEHGEKLDNIDKRVRKVEIRSAISGTLGGTIAGVGVSLLVAKIRTGLGV